VISLVWRRGLAFAVALSLGLGSFDFLHALVYHVQAAHLPSNAWKPLLDFVCLASILLSIGMAYTVIAYGLKDAFTQQVTSVWGLACLLTAYWWVPAVRLAAIVFGAWVLLCAIWFPAHRRALLATIVAISSGIAAYLIFGWYVMQSLAASDHAVFKELPFFVAIFSLAIQPVIYALVRAMFWRNTLRGHSA
jgi:hypothetical protein